MHLILFLSIFCISLAWSFNPVPITSLLRQHSQHRQRTTPLYLSSFYGKFEEDDFEEEDDEDDEEDDDEEDDDDDDYDDLDDLDVANFRTRMSSMFGEGSDEGSSTGGDSSGVDELISFATAGVAKEEPTDWAEPANTLKPGTILLANPAKFCADFGGPAPSRSLLSKYGLTLPPPVDLGPDRRADLLPVLLVVEVSNGCRAVLLNRRTGHLLGDLEQPAGDDNSAMPLLEKFCIQPLWFGGVDNVSSGLDMLHQCPAVIGAEPLTEDGLFWGGDPTQAQDAMSDPSLDRVLTGFDFKFFVQSTTYGPGEIEKLIENKTFYLANVSKEVMFKSRDRMGTRRAKPLWTEVMELLGGEYTAIRDQLYEDS